MSLIVLHVAAIVGLLLGASIAVSLFVIARELRALRLGKLRKPLAGFLENGAAAYAARLKDQSLGDEVLQQLHAVTAFAQHGVKEFDKSLRAGAAAPGSSPTSSSTSSVMDPLLSAPATRVDRPPSDGTASPPA